MIQTKPQDDEAIAKGAVEQETPAPNSQEGNASLVGQLGHRDQDEMLKESDTDFPEPGAKPEHSGQ